MQTLYSDIARGSQKPTLGLAPEAVTNFYEQLLNPQERISKDVPMMKNGLVGGTGFTGYFFKGFPILADEKATAQTLFFVKKVSDLIVKKFREFNGVLSSLALGV